MCCIRSSSMPLQGHGKTSLSFLSPVYRLVKVMVERRGSASRNPRQLYSVLGQVTGARGVCATHVDLGDGITAWCSPGSMHLLLTDALRFHLHNAASGCRPCALYASVLDLAIGKRCSVGGNSLIRAASHFTSTTINSNADSARFRTSSRSPSSTTRRSPRRTSIFCSG